MIQYEYMDIQNPKKWVLIVSFVVIILLIIFGGYFLVKKQSFSTENVTVAKTDFKNNTGKDKLPSGFPLIIPVETQGIIESTTLTYPDRGDILHSVVYNSVKSAEENYIKYQKFLTSSGFTLTITEKSPTQIFLRATQDKSEISITFILKGPVSLVQIAYVIRK